LVENNLVRLPPENWWPKNNWCACACLRSKIRVYLCQIKIRPSISPRLKIRVYIPNKHVAVFLFPKCCLFILKKPRCYLSTISKKNSHGLKWFCCANLVRKTHPALLTLGYSVNFHAFPQLISIPALFDL
jgi:hypothetical protein